MPRAMALHLLGWSLLLLAAGLSGCSRQEGSGTIISFWAMGSEGERVGELVTRFEQTHPGIEVRVQRIPWSAAHEKLLTAYAGDTMPDVFQLGNTWIPEFVALRAVVPLDQRLRNSTAISREDFFSGILATNRIDGQTWGIPWYVDTRLLYYRSDLLEDAGHPSMPRTWDGWIAAMRSIRAGGGQDRFPVLLPIRDWTAPVILAMQLGATLLRDDARYGDFRSSEFRRAFETYVGLFRQGLAPARSQSQMLNMYQAFADGEFAMFISGPWNMRELDKRMPEALHGSWATAPIPSPDDTFPSVSLAGGASLAVSRSSEHADAAWALVEYLAAPRQQIAFHALTGDLPSNRAAWSESGLRDDPRTRAFWTQLQNVRPTPVIPEWERIANKIAQYSESAIRGEISPDEALDRLDRDVDGILEKRRWLLQRRDSR